MTQNNALVIENLSHSYDNNKASNLILDSINLKIRDGELLGLLGPSGCGKTTLLRLIAGFEIPREGRIILNNNEISSSKNILVPEKRNIGMVFQDYALFPHLNVWDNVCFGINKKEQSIKRAKWLLELLDIYKLKQRYPHELSGGQSQRVALARAMAPGTSLVLLDEPFCSLDVEVRSRLRSELSSVLKSCSASAVLVTHDPHEALAICDRVAVLRNGEIQQYSTPLEMVCNPSNDFVGKFVLQKNIIPIKYINGSYSTCIGELHFSSDKSISSKSVCMFDKNAIRLQRSENDNFRVVSKEYRISHFVFTVINEGFKLRAEMSLDTDLSIGDKCKVETIKEKSFLILPENIKSIF